MLEQMIRHILPKHVSPTTYALGILQAKSYRRLKAETAGVLKGYGITNTDWAILGILSEAPDGLGLTALGGRLEVRLPLVTVRLNRLAAERLVSIAVSNSDSRRRLARLTAKGRSLVPIVELELRQKIRPLFHGASVRDLVGFVNVLAYIVEGGETGGVRKA